MNTTLERKIQTLKKLINNGCTNEKKLEKLNLESVLHISGITVSDMMIILEFQKHVKSGTLFSYFGGTINGRNNIQQQTCNME